MELSSIPLNQILNHAPNSQPYPTLTTCTPKQVNVLLSELRLRLPLSFKPRIARILRIFRPVIDRF
jgi:hypothetical protein